MSPVDKALDRLYSLRPLGHDTSDYRARSRLAALGSLGHLGYLCRLRIYRVHRDQRHLIERKEFLRLSHEPVFVDDLRREYGRGEYELAIYRPSGVAYLDKPEVLYIDSLGIFGGLPMPLAVIVLVFGDTDALLLDLDGTRSLVSLLNQPSLLNAP